MDGDFKADGRVGQRLKQKWEKEMQKKKEEERDETDSDEIQALYDDPG